MNDVDRTWREALVPPTMSIRDTLVVMGKTRLKIALVVDVDNRLIGTVADGDVRRSILNGIPTDQPVKEIMHPNPSTISPETTRVDQIQIMRDRKIHHLPIVNQNRQVVGLVSMDELLAPRIAEKPNVAVILAGGLGSRLSPLTDKKPKPLLPVGGRPVLETIIRQLHDHGIHHMYFAVNHLADAIKDHFGAGEKFGIKIDYIEENKRLGTAGPLGLLAEVPEEPFIVMNGDILTNVDFSDMLNYHKENNAIATVATRTFEFEVPFGVIENDGHQIIRITEKPVRQFQVNAGIYVFEPEVLSRISSNEHLDMPEFISALIDDGKAVAGFPIHEYWTDIGRLEDLNHASGEFADVFS
jgi:dTDP-glucose pyrophosphorylase